MSNAVGFSQFQPPEQTAPRLEPGGIGLIPRGGGQPADLLQVPPNDFPRLLADNRIEPEGQMFDFKS